MNEKRKLALERNWLDISFDSKWVLFLIIETKDYVVWIDNKFDIDWETTDDYDNEENKSDKKKRYEIINRAAELECVPLDHHSKGIRLNYRRMIGEGVARSLEHDFENAQAMMQKATDYIKKRKEDQNRFWYLIASGIAGLICIVISLFIWINRENVAVLLGVSGLFILLASLAGGIGALLSIILRIGKVNTDIDAGRSIHYLEGVSRIVAGCIAGLLLSLLIRSEIIFPFFKSIELKNYALIGLSLTFGISERYIPSIITQVIDKNLSEQENINVEG